MNPQGVKHRAHLLAALTTDHTEQAGAACAAMLNFQKGRQGNTCSDPVGPAKDSDRRVMRVNSCLLLVTQLGAKILNTLRQDIYLLHSKLPFAKQALSRQEEGGPISHTWQPLQKATTHIPSLSGELLLLHHHHRHHRSHHLLSYY